MDHIFSLNAIIELYLANRKKLYCAFVDLKKAFDSVHRISLWKKLIAHNVNGNIIKVIYNMYEGAKSCVAIGEDLSNSFLCKVGVRQGDNLSPLLFSIFLNDLESHLSRNFSGLSFLRDQIYSELEDEDTVTFLRLFILLYADDTIILAESAAELQLALDSMSEYCQNWSLNVNVDKTKIVIFSRGKVRNIPNFIFDNEPVEVVDEFRYLGVIFNYNNRFDKCKRYLYDQAHKAMYSVIQKARKFLLPIDIMLELFDKLVIPIISYGAEVWGYSNTLIIEKLHLKFLKMLLHVKRSTPNCMVYGELGAYPLHITTNSKILGFWSRICNDKRQDKISVTIYKLLKVLDDKGIFTSQWIAHVKWLLDSLGMSDLWLNSHFNPEWFKSAIALRLRDQYIQSWSNDVNNSNLCANYKLFKTSFKLESYLLKLHVSERVILTKFRTSNLLIPVNSMRFSGVDRAERRCDVCELNEIGDEFHYLFVCSFFSTERKLYLKKLYYIRPNILKFAELLKGEQLGPTRKLVKFIKIISHIF